MQQFLAYEVDEQVSTFLGEGDILSRRKRGAQTMFG